MWMLWTYLGGCAVMVFTAGMAKVVRPEVVVLGVIAWPILIPVTLLYLAGAKVEEKWGTK